MQLQGDEQHKYKLWEYQQSQKKSWPHSPADCVLMWSNWTTLQELLPIFVYSLIKFTILLGIKIVPNRRHLSWQIAFWLAEASSAQQLHAVAFTNHQAISFVKCWRAAWCFLAKRITVCTKLPVKIHVMLQSFAVLNLSQKLQNCIVAFKTRVVLY